MKKIGLIGWRPFVENTTYSKEWGEIQILSQIEELESLADLHYISTCELIGCIQTFEEFQFRLCDVMNRKHIISLNFNNFRYFLENILSQFDILVTSHHNYPFMMLINKYAKKYNVKVIFIQHGMQNDISKEVGRSRVKGFLNKYTLANYKALFKQLFFSLRMDSKVTYLTIKNIIFKGSALIYPRYFRDEYKFDKLLVYSEKEKNIYATLYNKSQIHIILDADIKLYLNYKDEKYKSVKKYVLYIDDEVIKDYKLYDDFNNFVVSNFLEKGYDFFYLPRGRNDQLPIYGKLHKDIIYLEPRSINKYIDNADEIISTWSTLLNLPIYLKKKMILLVTNDILKQMKQINKYDEFTKNKNINFFNLKEMK